MVKIIDGEIVQDDDPRLTNRGAGNGPRTESASGGPAPAAQGALFDWNAPPLRVVHDPHGQGIGGLPSLLVYGAPLTSTQLVLLLGAGLFMGLRGLLFGAIIWFIYSTSQRAQQAAWAQQQPRHAQGADVGTGAGASQQQRSATASNIFSSFMGQAPLGARSGRGPGGPAGEAAGPGGQASRGVQRGSSWESKGKAYKLSG